MKKYYWILYRSKCSKLTLEVGTLIDVHPIQWQVDTNQKYRASHGESYTVLNWKEVDEEVFKKFKDDIG